MHHFYLWWQATMVVYIHIYIEKLGGFVAGFATKNSYCSLAFFYNQCEINKRNFMFNYVTWAHGLWHIGSYNERLSCERLINSIWICGKLDWIECDVDGSVFIVTTNVFRTERHWTWKVIYIRGLLSRGLYSRKKGRM